MEANGGRMTTGISVYFLLQKILYVFHSNSPESKRYLTPPSQGVMSQKDMEIDIDRYITMSYRRC